MYGPPAARGIVYAALCECADRLSHRPSTNYLARPSSQGSRARDVPGRELATATTTRLPLSGWSCRRPKARIPLAHHDAAACEPRK
jgi:hypothetical protein